MDSTKKHNTKDCIRSDACDEIANIMIRSFGSSDMTPKNGTYRYGEIFSRDVFWPTRTRDTGSVSSVVAYSQ